VSANGTSNGIVWAHENTSPAVLHAYEASNLAHELYTAPRPPVGAINSRAQQVHYAHHRRRQGVRGTPAGVAVFGC